MDQFSKRRIAMFHLRKDYNAVTEEEWVQWFLEAQEEDPMDLKVLKKRLGTAIRFDMLMRDADSHVGRMLDELMTVLEKDNQEWVFHQEGKMIVTLMVKAVRPATLQKAVARQMLLQRNKPLKMDVFRFTKWLRTFAKGFQLYSGPKEDDGKPKAVEAKAAGEGGASGGGGGEKKSYASASKAIVADSKPACESKKAERKQRKVPEVWLGRPQGGRLPRLRRLRSPVAVGCADRQVEARARPDAKGEAAGRGSAMNRAAVVEDVLPVATLLLDNGSDVSLVTGGLVAALEDAGVAVEFVKGAAEQKLQPYGAQPPPC